MHQKGCLAHEFDLNLDMTRRRRLVYNFENLFKTRVHITCGSDNTK